MRTIFLMAVMLLLYPLSKAQELNCNVTLNSDQIQGTNKQVFNTLQQSISDFVNNTRWSNMTVANSERIECNITIVVKTAANNFYGCEMQIQARRPIYNSAYNSPLLNYRDNYFNFTYTEFDQLQYQESVFTSNLTALLAYYCNLIIGYDMDSYSRLGGTPFFQQAENIVNAAQSATMESGELQGWKAFESNRNRYALINNLMDESFKKYRNYFYEYHRLGLDEMSNNVANGRARIASGLPILRETNRARPSAVAISSFLDAKSDELVNILSQSPEKEKQESYNVLMDIDPTRGNTYDKIINQ